MNAPVDVYRSLRRYVWEMLGVEASSSRPWVVRLGRVRVADDERPVAVVEQSAPVTTPRSRAGTISQGDVQKAQTFTAVAYPSLGATAPESTLAAAEVADLLDAGFSRGLVTDDDPPVNIGAPWRMPVYDYDGVPIGGAGRAGPAAPYMYADVASTFSVRPLQDAVDELRYTVVATIPLTWWQGGRIPPAAPTAQTLPGVFTPPAP